jgi:hypothetical protein
MILAPLIESNFQLFYLGGGTIPTKLRPLQPNPRSRKKNVLYQWRLKMTQYTIMEETLPIEIYSRSFCVKKIG